MFSEAIAEVYFWEWVFSEAEVIGGHGSAEGWAQVGA
jgi:hypothetical protein